MNVMAAVSRDANAAFSLEEISLDNPRDDEILVKIAGVGLCHSDLLAHNGTIPVPLPAVFGHEGAGQIVAVGPAVRGRKVGERVVLTFNSCGVCGHCHDDDPAYCDSTGLLNYAGDVRTAQKRSKVEKNRFRAIFLGNLHLRPMRSVLNVMRLWCPMMFPSSLWGRWAVEYKPAPALL